MSIAPISGNSNIAFSSFGDSNAIRLLEKQKMQLQEQIQKTNESKMDDKTKRERVKELQAQIQQVDMEIQQLRNERLNQTQNTKQQAAESKPSVNDNGDNGGSPGMAQLIQASTTYSQAQIMNRVKSDLKSQGNKLKTEIKLDEQRGGEAKAKRAELQEIESRVQMLDKKVGEMAGTALDQANEAANQASENENINNDIKDEQNNQVSNHAAAHESQNTQGAKQGSSTEEENSQQAEIKLEDKRYKRVDIRV